jgi:hypothetical protein
MSRPDEVFRLTEFDTNKCYEFALETKTEGKLPHQKYYALTPLQYVGAYMYSERWGTGDNRGGAENFKDMEGVTKRIVYDYDGMICFREVQYTSIERRIRSKY